MYMEQQLAQESSSEMPLDSSSPLEVQLPSDKINGGIIIDFKGLDIEKVDAFIEYLTFFITKDLLDDFGLEECTLEDILYG